MWAAIKAQLVAHLTEQLDGVDVLPYPTAETPAVDTVMVARGPSAANDARRTGRGTDDLVIQCWTDGHANEAATDAALEALENRVLEALETLPSTAPGVRNLSLSLLGIDPDGDLFRPAVGSQINLRVDWRTY